MPFELRLHHDGVDVTFNMIHADKRDVVREAERLGVSDADQQRTDKSGTFGDRDRSQVLRSGRRRIRALHGPPERLRADARVMPVSGTTPPYLPCVLICEATIEESTRGASSTTAAAVSSHELSIPRMSKLHILSVPL